MTTIDFSSSLINAAWCHSTNAYHILHLASITATKRVPSFKVDPAAIRQKANVRSLT